jgi:hypothetical protein
MSLLHQRWDATGVDIRPDEVWTGVAAIEQAVVIRRWASAGVVGGWLVAAEERQQPPVSIHLLSGVGQEQVEGMPRGGHLLLVGQHQPFQFGLGFLGAGTLVVHRVDARGVAAREPGHETAVESIGGESVAA